MEATISITGYEKDVACEHCGRSLTHGIRISSGLVVGAQCFRNQMVKPRYSAYMRRAIRPAIDDIINVAMTLESGKRWPFIEDYTFEVA